jgi:hypothetical protein
VEGALGRLNKATDDINKSEKDLDVSMPPCVSHTLSGACAEARAGGGGACADSSSAVEGGHSGVRR